MALKISNRDARKLWLHSHGLGCAPIGTLDVLQIVKDLGFVQIDSIRNVTRAHHHILWSRNQNYREPMLWKCLANDRTLFEHFTHDASLIPMDYYPFWQVQFARMYARLSQSNYYKNLPDAAARAAIKARIEREGALSTQAFSTKIRGEKEMWSRPPHKTALDYMWNIGELSTCHRKNFNKFYDLTHRIVPEDIQAISHSQDAQIDWLCRAALERLGMGSPREIQKFWDAVSLDDVKNWSVSASRDLITISVQAADKSWQDILAHTDIETRLKNTQTTTSRLRIINPFDPAIRDRDRLFRLFGFTYKNEIFVPAAKRRWGYYVYPLLEGDRFVGRIELKADRKAGNLTVKNLWSEMGVKWTSSRSNKLSAEIQRLARMIGVANIVWDCASSPA